MSVLMEVKDLKVHFPLKGGGLLQKPKLLKAVDGVSFALEKGRSLGIVGESGCGKTTAALAMVGLRAPSSGEIKIDGEPVYGVDRLRAARLVQLVFQDPYSSLNPRATIYTTISRAMRLHGLAEGTDLRTRIASLLETVGLRGEHMDRFPHQFSGGQRQRLCIARALALSPQILVGDEPVSALDVSVQAQILNLLLRLQKDLGLSMVIISHNLAVVEYLCDDIIVMYLGKVVERGAYDDITRRALHPYTQALIAAAPSGPGRSASARAAPKGELPSPIDPPPGCPFNPRCERATDLCRKSMPALQSRGERHGVACHHA
ncbi:ABC transporter ATP-binding protein [Mesorhizobium sp. 1B3]|uniref:ABC transporter ATP-binding protein n=1 Tax=Mesorhizobium sp. 1B3 TaxID=3243599 RepID=UPI003D990664